MTIRFKVMFAFLFCLLLPPTVEAQITLKNGKIPDDLLITLKRQECCIGGENSEITITAKGDWSSQSRGGLPILMPDRLSIINGKPVKPPKYLKPKLSAEKLKSLLAEFEKIQFFKFGDNFPLEDKKTITSVNHSPTEIISIRINGQTKEVSNYLGTFMNRTKLLRDLAEKVCGAGVWNFENGKIPEDLNIIYYISYGQAGFRKLIIKADGKVLEENYSNIPSEPAIDNLLKSVSKAKTAKPKDTDERATLKDKLSKKQIEQLISEFENVGFSSFRHIKFDEQNGCTNADITTDSRVSGTKYLSVQINGKTMYASTYASCKAKPGSDAAKFEYILVKIEELLKILKP